MLTAVLHVRTAIQELPRVLDAVRIPPDQQVMTTSAATIFAMRPPSPWRDRRASCSVDGHATQSVAHRAFSAVKIDVHEGMSAADYRAWISAHGLAPALSNFVTTFDEDEDNAGVVERARLFAEQQLELGVYITMLTARMIPRRLAEPAVGAGFDACQRPIAATT